MGEIHSPSEDEAALARQLFEFGESPTLVATKHVRDLLAMLAEPRAATKTERRILLAWERLPDVSGILDQVLDELAEAARAFWPQWYVADPGGESTATQAALLERATQAGVRREVSDAWLRAADAACRNGQSPRRMKFTPEVEARQLALALGGQACRLILATEDSEASSAALLGLASAVQWLATQTKWSLVVAVSPELARRAEFDSVNFRVREWEPQESPSSPPIEVQPRISSPGRRPQRFVHPLVGNPHPHSQGEQLLWECMQNDGELNGLFRCNEFTAAAGGQEYLVDFVWKSGKFLVEVDGWYWHSSREAFARDRRRDYEFLLAGYCVLRLPHDEVVADVAAAMEKIRNVVRLRRAEEMA